MKKIVVSFVAGALLMVSAQAVGSGINMIGKKVDGQNDVIINGEVVGQAIIIQGKSYAPVRELTTGLGGKVESVKGGKISLSQEEQLPITRETEIHKENEKAVLTNKINGLKAVIQSSEEEVESLSDQVADLKIKADNDTTTVGAVKIQYNIFSKSLEDKKTELSKLNEQLNDLESQLAGLQK